MSERKTSLDKALKVIDTVAKEGRIGVRPLAQETGYPPSTIHRILAVLIRNRYFRQDPATKEYQLSSKFLELAARVKGGWDITTLAKPIMRRLMRATGETVNLVVFEDMTAVYVEQVSNPETRLRMFTQVGAVVDLYCSGVGKAYLASLDDNQVRDYFRGIVPVTFTANTLTSEAALMADLEATRNRGFAIDNGEQEDGVRCVAAAIRLGGGPGWALSISGPSTRITQGKTDGMGRLVVEAATRISKDLSGS